MNADAETIAGFYEEARGYLMPLAECVATLSASPADPSALAEMHRLVHLIRGASTVVGLSQLTMLSEGLETYLEDLSAGHIHFDDSTLATLEEAVSAIGMNLETSQPTPAPAPAPAVVRDVDPEILDGFFIEAREALDLISQRLRDAESDPRVLAEVRRAVHTLKGAGAMVGLHNLSQVAHRMEDSLDAIAEGRQQLNAERLKALTDSTDWMLHFIETGGEE
ncbi:MAG: Hpt domain-containing protein, partial [Bryobacteraceae bacterium]|nr:Hpt domain-containing protein [Bryobacteraceae bacterium]